MIFIYTNKKEIKNFLFQITAVSINQNGKEYKSVDTYQTRTTVTGKGLSLKVALGGAGAAFFVILVIVIIVCFVWRHRHPKHLQIYRMEDGTGKIYMLLQSNFEPRALCYVHLPTY